MDQFKITIKAARVNAGLTQQEVADLINVGRTSVINWEMGHTSPSVEKAEAFCKACNVPFDRVTFSRERNAIK